MNDSEFVLKLRRQHSKEEVIQVIEKELRNSQLLLGQCKSEVAHLEFQLKYYKTEVEKAKTKGWTKQFMKDEHVRQLDATIKKLSAQRSKFQEENKKLKKDVEYWQTKYLNERQKNQAI